MSETKTKNELVIVIEESGLQEETKKNALQAYQPFMQQLEDISLLAKMIDFENPKEEDSDTARKLRLQLVKVRTGAEGEKKKRKENILLLGKLEDHATGVIVTSSKIMEELLEKVEKHAERLAQEAREKLKSDRAEQLAPFEVDTTYIPLAVLSDEDFKKLLSDSEILFNAKKDLERKKEADRVAAEQAEAEKQEGLRLENERLKAEATEREKKTQEEKEALAKSRQTGEARMSILASIGVSLDFNSCSEMSEDIWNEFFNGKNDAYQAEKNREALSKMENDRLKKQLEEKRLSEEKEQNEKIASEKENREKERKAALAPDKDKLLGLIAQLDAIVFPHSVVSDNAKKAVNDTIGLVEKVKEFITKRSEEL